MFISAVIPAYFEKENLGELTRRLISALDDSRMDYEILYVIQGNDGSKEFLDNLKNPKVKYLYYPEPLGVSRAFLEGFQAVINRADLVLTMDADLNHQPEEIAGLLAKLKEKDADITIGSRYIAGGKVIGMPLWKKLSSRWMNKIINLFSGIKVADKTSGFRIYKKKAVQLVIDNLKAENFEFYPEVILLASKNGLTFAETPITFKFRVRGESKMYKLQTMAGYLKMFWRKLWKR
jgi:dolichol-phosphate mannosyltransferase